MSEIRIRWSVADEVQLDRAFTRLAIDVKDFTEPLAAAKEIVKDETLAQFEAEGDPGWADLNSRYKAWKARHFPGKTKLICTEALLHSLTGDHADGAIREITPTTLRYGTSLEVGETRKWNLGLIHQLGTKDGRIPARPMLRLRRQGQTRIVRAFREHFIRLANAAGLHP
ncbi:MAG: hypothetical protein ABFE07_02030 [Armatimonadia bacterium]